MSSNRTLSLIGGLVFLCIAALALYRLMVWFPVVIGGMEIGQTSSFFVFVASSALSLAFFLGGRPNG